MRGLRFYATFATALTVSALGAQAAASATVHPNALPGVHHARMVLTKTHSRLVTQHNRSVIGHHVATPATSTGSWSASSSEPVLYNYGLISTGPIINPPSGLPAGAVITNVCWTWNYTYPHPASGIWVFVYNNTSGFYDTSGNELGCTTLDNGQAASQQFEFGFASPGGTSTSFPPILPPAAPSGPATVTVYYSY